MMSFPYPRQRTKRRVALVILMWIFGMAVAPWILSFPPQSYSGFGLVASVGWGVMVGLGSAIMLIGWLKRSYIVEGPGLLMMFGGIFIYAILSWEQTLGGSGGSGARALLLCMGTCALLIRADTLNDFRLTLKRVDRIGRGGE